MLLSLVVILQVCFAVVGGSSPPRERPLKNHGVDDTSASREAQIYGQKEFVSHNRQGRFVKSANTYVDLDIK